MTARDVARKAETKGPAIAACFALTVRCNARRCKPEAAHNFRHAFDSHSPRVVVTGSASPSLLAYGWRSIWRLFECFNMAARGTLIGNQLAHCAETRHPADRCRAFAQTGTIVGQLSKLRQNADHAQMIWCKAKLTIPGSPLREFR